MEDWLRDQSKLPREVRLELVNAPNSDGQTPLQLLLNSGLTVKQKITLGELLVAVGADPSVTNDQNQTLDAMRTYYDKNKNWSGKNRITLHSKQPNIPQQNTENDSVDNADFDDVLGQ